MRIFRIAQSLVADALPPGKLYEVFPTGSAAIQSFAGDGKYLIDPNGKWLAVEEHEDASTEIFRNIGQAEGEHSSRNMDQYNAQLASMGWLRINEVAGDGEVNELNGYMEPPQPAADAIASRSRRFTLSSRLRPRRWR